MRQERYIEASILADLPQKMVFVAGPRQVGKSTLAKSLVERHGSGLYLSWDQTEDRRRIQKAEWPPGESLVVLDELHKYRQWKRWLKGEFDKHRDHLRFLVTGSARLDVYRRGGDSLQGRYHHFRLHPFSLAEQSGWRPHADFAAGSALAFRSEASADTVHGLLRFGGFPEPFLAASDRVLRRWQKERLERFFREDVRDLESVRDLSSLQHLADLVSDRIGAPLSLNSLREDLDASHRAVSHWVDVLDRLYYLFMVRPFTHRSVRGLKKMAKVFLWDWGSVREPGARFENLVAAHLLKFCHFLEDRDGYQVELHFLRDAHGREVDFLVTLDRQPWLAVEAKSTTTEMSPSLRYFGDRLKIPFLYQVVRDGTRDFVREGVRCLPAHVFLSGLV